MYENDCTFGMKSDDSHNSEGGVHKKLKTEAVCPSQRKKRFNNFKTRLIFDNFKLHLQLFFFNNNHLYEEQCNT